MGTPEFSVPTLKALINSDHEIVTVYTQPAKRANRGQKIKPSSVEIFTKNHSLKLKTPTSLDSDKEYNYFKKIKPDLVIVVAYGKIIPQRFLKIVKYGFINLHASLLPKWRGAAPIQRSIMNLDNETGISIMRIEEELDTGPVMHQDKININENIDSLSLSKILSEIGAKAILNSLNKIINNKAIFKEQNHKEATYAKKISKKEAKIDWNENAIKVLAKINGLNPNPGAWFEYENQRYKVWKAKITEEEGETGNVINDNLTVACKSKSLTILEIQKEGKNKQSTEQFLAGNQIKKGKYLT